MGLGMILMSSILKIKEDNEKTVKRKFRKNPFFNLWKRKK